MSKIGKPFGAEELSGFCSQMAMLLASGISLPEGLDMMLEDAEGRQEQELLETLKEALAQHGEFAPALEQTGVFPDYMTQMVRIGEQTGRLDDVMTALAEHFGREAAISQSIRSAVMYPAVMLCMMLLIVGVLLTNVMPVFNQVFLQLGTEMTGLSRMLMDLGSLIRRYGAVLGCLAAMLVALGLWFAMAARGRKAFAALCYRIPPARRLFEMLGLARFAGGMHLALSSGLDPEYALELVSRLSEDAHFQTRLDQCRQEMEAGESWISSLRKTGILTGLSARMAAIGEKTGTVAETMKTIAANAQEEADRRISGALGLIEPALVILLSVMVGIILLSVMFPLLGILSGM